MRSPILFLVFNRPKTTRQVFDAIRAGRPKKLYVAADGPRVEHRGEAELCAEVRRIATAVDWPCEVRTLFRERNLGCKMGVSGGIDWFFEHEPEGIILEDDVRPVSTFFRYCDDLLDRYRTDDRVSMISGSNMVDSHLRSNESYVFSRHTQIWGWASWRRAWRHYDVAMADWPAWRDGGGLKRISGGSRLFEIYWRHTFHACHQGKKNTWDYQWTFANWRRGALTILPAVNQTDNVGFGSEATHTLEDVPDYVSASPARPMQFPLTHPTKIERDVSADNLIDSMLYGIDVPHFIKRVPRLTYTAFKSGLLGRLRK